MMRFLKVRLKNWRNFRDVDVPLQSRAFIVGPNASGKSNFLDALRFLQDIADPNGGLLSAIGRRGGISKIRWLSARRPSDLVVDVEIGDKEDKSEWRYRIVLAQDNQRISYVKSEEVWEKNRKILNRPDKQDKKDRIRQRQTHLEQISANEKFRNLSQFLSLIDYRHVIPQLIREPDRYAAIGLIQSQRKDPFGSDLLVEISRTPEKTRTSRLKKIQEALNIAVPQLRQLKLEKDEAGKPHLTVQYEHWRPNAGWQREDQFSDGTLRLLGLLWSVLDYNSPLLLEEPELSLHPNVVQNLPKMLLGVSKKRRRQIILTTHSPDILGDSSVLPNEIIVVKPGKDGSEVSTAKDDEEICKYVKAGYGIDDVVRTILGPESVGQLEMFGSR